MATYFYILALLNFGAAAHTYKSAGKTTKRGHLIVRSDAVGNAVVGLIALVFAIVWTF